MTSVHFAESESDLLRCHPVVFALRPHLEPSEFIGRVKLQWQEGYRLVFLESDGAVASVAGFRILHSLWRRRFLYVDDLVTSEAARSRGHGHALFEWLVQHAREQSCDALHLDSGVQRFEAHRFYFRERMAIQAHHFVLPLE